jgi:AcrR family transcriptional regulator
MEITKNKILSYSKEVIITHGYKNFRVDDIAKSLGISKSTIYKIFSSKEEIVKAVIKYHFEIIRNEFEKILADMESPKFTDKMIKIINLKNHNIPFLSTKVIEDLKHQIPDIIDYIQELNKSTLDRFFQLIDLGVEQGYVKKHIEKKVIYFIHFFSIRNIMQYEVQTQIPLEATEIIRQIQEVIFSGILTQKAHNELDNVLNCEEKK